MTRGKLVHFQRAGSRSFEDPRDDTPNSNPPVGTVGPNVPAGIGDVHALYPEGNLDLAGNMPDVQAWQGWPVGWDTPNWNSFDDGFTKRLSTLWTCIDYNTRQLASFPIYGMKGVSPFQLPEWSNNPEPEIYSDWIEFAKQLFNTFQSFGESILWCTGRYADESVARFVALNPSYVNIERRNGEISYSFSGKPLDRRDVCHIKYESVPMNLRGIGPLEWCSRSIISAQSLEKMATDIATRGGIPWAVLKSERKLNARESQELKNAWLQGALSRNGAPAVISGTISLDSVTISPREMALLDLRIFDESRIAAALGVPPYLVGLPSPPGFTYSNSVSLLDIHWRTTLRTMARSAASALSNWLLPRGKRIEFNRDEYVAPEPLVRAQTDQILFNLIDEKGNRAKTIDEIRLNERYEPYAPTALEQGAQL